MVSTLTYFPYFLRRRKKERKKKRKKGEKYHMVYQVSVFHLQFTKLYYSSIFRFYFLYAVQSYVGFLLHDTFNSLAV